MNMEIKARDLIAAGWHEGRHLGPALRRFAPCVSSARIFVGFDKHADLKAEAKALMT